MRNTPPYCGAGSVELGFAAVEAGADAGAGADEVAGLAAGDEAGAADVAAGLAAVEEAGAVADGVEVPQAVSRNEMTRTVTRGISNFFTIFSFSNIVYSIIKPMLKYTPFCQICQLKKKLNTKSAELSRWESFYYLLLPCGEKLDESAYFLFKCRK
jgi:hypothetical protein